MCFLSPSGELEVAKDQKMEMNANLHLSSFRPLALKAELQPNTHENVNILNFKYTSIRTMID